MDDIGSAASCAGTGPSLCTSKLDGKPLTTPVMVPVHQELMDVGLGVCLLVCVCVCVCVCAGSGKRQAEA